MHRELLHLQQAWPVSNVCGEPFLTQGALIVTGTDGGVLLSLSSGDEDVHTNLEVQYPLSVQQIELVVRALRGQHVGDVAGNG